MSRRGKHFTELRARNRARLLAGLGRLNKKVLSVDEILEVGYGLGLSRRTIYYIIKDLVGSGDLIQVSRGRYVLAKYYLSYLLDFKPSEINVRAFKRFLKKKRFKDDLLARGSKVILDLPEDLEKIFDGPIKSAAYAAMQIASSEDQFFRYFSYFLIDGMFEASREDLGGLYQEMKGMVSKEYLLKLIDLLYEFCIARRNHYDTLANKIKNIRYSLEDNGALS